MDTNALDQTRELLSRNPDRIPIIVNLYNDNKEHSVFKFLIPNERTIDELPQVLRQHYNKKFKDSKLSDTLYIYSSKNLIYTEGTVLSNSNLDHFVSRYYDMHKNKNDELLYLSVYTKKQVKIVYRFANLAVTNSFLVYPDTNYMSIFTKIKQDLLNHYKDEVSQIAKKEIIKADEALFYMISGPDDKQYIPIMSALVQDDANKYQSDGSIYLTVTKESTFG